MPPTAPPTSTTPPRSGVPISTPVRLYAALASLAWSLLIAGSLYWNFQELNKQATNIAIAQAHLTWNENQALRDWADQYDGVYVATRRETGRKTGPNQELDQNADRNRAPIADLAVPDRASLSIITVPQFIRQVQQKYTARFPDTEPIKTKILDLNDERADPWERHALERLSRENTKVLEQTTFDDRRYLRMMMGLYEIPQSCPTCPDALSPFPTPSTVMRPPPPLRGAISITVPLQPYFQAMKDLQTTAMTVNGGMWLIGLAMIAVLFKRGQQRNRERAAYYKKLMKSEDKYRQLIENAPEIIYSTSHQEGGLYWSHRVQDILGYSPQQLIDHPTLWRDSIHKDDCAKVDEAIAQATPGVSFETTYRICDAKGRWRYFHDRSVTRLTEQGDLIHDGMAYDITDKKETEQALANKEKQFATLQKSPSLAAIVSVDDHGMVSMWNSGAQKAFGYEECDIIGQPLTSLMPERFRAAHEAGLRRARNSSQRHFIGKTIELYGLHKDGHEFPIELSLGAWESDGKMYFSGIINDITERKADQERLRRAKEHAEKAQKEAERANHAKTHFLANMSHELRTPLNAIIGFSEIMNTQMLGPLSSTYQNYARDISSSGQLLLELITEILDTAKIESGNMKLNETEIGLHTLAEPCLKLVQQKSKDENVTVKINFPEDLPMLFADEVRVKQILLNLVSNAIKFNKPHGDVHLRAYLTDNKGLELTVTDTGRGIAEKDLATILQPFKQVENIMSRSHEGSGLGLPLSKNLIELHGGTLTIHSTPGQGTTVTVYFPPERVRYRHVQNAQDAI